MRQTANPKDLEVPTLLPGIHINTSPTDLYPIKQVQVVRFDDKPWGRFGEVLGE